MTKEDPVLTFILCCLALLLAIPIMLWDGYVLCVLWAWFAVPLGFVQLGLAHAIGIQTLIGTFLIGTQITCRKRDDEDEPGKRSLTVVLTYPLVYAFALGIGAICHAFM